MTRLINKDDLVAEIDNIMDYVDEHWDTDYAIGAQRFADKLQDAISTLEVKDVDLDESARYYLLHEHTSPLNDILHQANIKVEIQYHKDIEDAYKAGFELGLKTQKGE